MVASLSDLKYWKERDVGKWFSKNLGARLDDIVHDGRLDGAKILELDDRPKNFDRFLEKLGRKDFSKREIKKFERSFLQLMDDYHKKKDSRKRKGKRGRRSRKKVKSVWEKLDYRDKDYIHVDDLEAYLEDEFPSVDSKARKSLIKKLDRKKRGKIFSRDFYDILPRKGNFEDAVFDAIDFSDNEKGGWSKVSPSDLKKLDKHRFCTYMEFRCGSVFRTYASQLMSMGHTVKNVYDFNTEDYRIIPPFHRREFMEAIRKPDLQLLGDIIGKNKGGGKKFGKKCPQKAKDVWTLMDKHDCGRVYMRQFWRFMKKHCSWVKERDCIKVFDFLDQRGKDYVSWKAFMKCFRGREFERELEDIIYDLGGRSKLKTRMTGREAWNKIDKLDRGKIRRRNFEDFCLDLNISRRDIKEAWRRMDWRDSGKVRKSAFHEVIPKKGDFVGSMKKLMKQTQTMKGDINFADLTTEQLQMWLEYVGPSYEIYGPVFENHRITGNDLVTLSDRDLEVLIPNEKHRRTLLDKAIYPDQEILRELFFTDSDWDKYYRLNAYNDGSEIGGGRQRIPRSVSYYDDAIGMPFWNSPRMYGSDAYDERRRRRLRHMY